MEDYAFFNISIDALNRVTFDAVLISVAAVLDFDHWVSDTE